MKRLLSSVNPETIETFTHEGNSFEIRFKDGSALKWKASSSVLSTGNRLLVGKEIVLPSSLLVGGKPSADGRARCKNPKCDVELIDENRVGGYCWECCKKLDDVDCAIAACEHLGTRHAADVVRKAVTQLVAEEHKDVDQIPTEVLVEYIYKHGVAR